MMNWSEHESEELPKQRPLMLPVIFWIGSIACVIGLIARLTG